MKAILQTAYGGPEILRVAEVPRPEPDDHGILIRVHATLVTAADGMMRSGIPKFGRLMLGLTKPKKPIPGTEVAGVVEEVGSAVTRFEVGDRVVGSSDTSFGAHAEYMCLPDSGVLAAIPENFDFAEAVAVCEGAMTALPFLRDMGMVQPGQKVLINGASGSVGSAAVQLAKHLGAEVTGVCSAANVELVKSLGADSVIDYAKEDFANGSDRYDVVFDTVGNRTFAECRRVLTPSGRYLSSVLSAPLLARVLWTSMFGGQKAKFAATGIRSHDKKIKDQSFILQLAEQGTLRPVIDRHFTFEDIPGAHRYVDTGHKKGCLVIDVTSESS
jgi:NADPH:quinone reductase-like Zn-dependent oxidoreductase